MPSYRAYLLNSQGKIVRGDWLEAATPDEAMAKAQELCDQSNPTVELWQGAIRLGVARCPPDGPA